MSKGSRQNGSVPSVEGLALRTGFSAVLYFGMYLLG